MNSFKSTSFIFFWIRPLKPGVLTIFLLAASFGLGAQESFVAASSEDGSSEAASLAIPQDTMEYSDKWRSDALDTSLALKHRRRQRIIGYGSIGLYGGMLIGLNQAWYAQYPRSSFHFYNDNGEWNQVDKVGHSWSTYQLTRSAFGAWKWAGASDRKAMLYAGISGPGFLTVIEILDAFSSNWGFSWGDMGANIFGSGLFLGQEALWGTQKLQFKFSFHRKNYAEPLLEQRANDLFGSAWNERMLKDYNAQTYWLSANLKSFFPESRLPEWLNISLGYGADNMYGGYSNEWANESGENFSRHEIPRIRQFYLAPDIDLTRIKTRHKWLRTSFYLLNCLKFPAPALELDSRGKLKGHLIYF
ncbi:DUF2279 domain-containing protein [Niabella terrae]